MNPCAGFSETRGRSQYHAQFINNTKSKAVDSNAGSAPVPSDRKKSFAKSIDLPTLQGLGISLDSKEIAKRNELDSVTLKPWSPGRGAVGVKLEVTW